MYLLDVARNFMARRSVFCEEDVEDVELQPTNIDPGVMFKSRDDVVKQNLLIEPDTPASNEPKNYDVTEDEIDAVIAKQTPKQRLEYMFVME